MSAPLRLSPTMASRKLLALAFIKRYWAEWGGSPSIGEIANAIGTNRTRAMEAVRSLDSDGLVVRRPGARGISLPDILANAVRELRSFGYKIDEDALHLNLPIAPGVTNAMLPLIAELDHIPDVEFGGTHDGNGQPG